MSCVQRDLVEDSVPEVDVDVDNDAKSADGENGGSSSPPVIHRTTIITVNGGTNVNVQVGDYNKQQHNLSKSLENLSSPYCCENCGSTGTSPVTTINRSFSTEYLDQARDYFTEPEAESNTEQRQRTVCSLIRKFNGDYDVKKSPSHQTSRESDNSVRSAPSFINSNPGDINADSYPEMDGLVGPGEYTWQDDNSSCSSLNGSESLETDSASVSSDPPSLPRRRKISAPKPQVKPKPKFVTAIPDDDDQYMSMDGSSTGSLTSLNPIPRLPKIKDQHCKKSGKIPRHKIEEAMATLGFRSDVNGELKRVRRILKPHKSKDGYYILWQFSPFVISLSVTFLQDIKNFAVCYDSTRKSWLILKDGPRSSSLAQLMQLYIRKGIKLPLAKSQSKGLGASAPPPKNHNTVPRESSRKTSVSYSNDKPPPLPPRRASAPALPVSHTGAQPALPPRPQGFLTLSKPVIQPLDDFSVTKL